MLSCRLSYAPAIVADLRQLTLQFCLDSPGACHNVHPLTRDE